MSMLANVTLSAVRYVVCGACKATLGLSEASTDRAISMLLDFYNDAGNTLPRTIEKASERAWTTLEIAFAGDSLWNRWTNRAEDVALARQLRSFLDRVDYAILPPDRAVFQQACLRELRAARQAGVLKAGRLDPQALRQQTQEFTRYSDPKALVAAEWQGLAQIAKDLRESYPNLSRFLGIRTTTDASGLPLLIVAFHYYFGTAVAKDEALSHRLLHAKLDALAAPSDAGMEKIAGLLDTHFHQIEAGLAGIFDTVQRIDAEMVRKEDLERFQAAVLQRLDRQAMSSNREIRPRDGMSIRSEDEREKVRDFLKQYRAMPESDRRQRPALLDAVAKLEFAAGDFEQAQADFALLPALLEDNAGKAQAHYNAYRAALERAGLTGDRNDWEKALAELIQAVKLDRKYMPFDASKYAPDRILGAGGFGVTFLCRHKDLDDFVAVKALLQEELELDADKVFAEGRQLRKIDHPAIIRMQHCGFADPEAKTRPYLVMDYFDGRTLEEYVAATGTVSLGEVVVLAKLLAAGMMAAHGQGVLHRDIKPANVMVRKDAEGWRAKIIDFGLALKRETFEAAAGSGTSQRAGGGIAGTIDYAAPEQMGKLPGVPVGPYSDVYGWAKTVWFALFKTPKMELKHVKSKEVPESLKDLLGACMDEDPLVRPQTFSEVLDRLIRIEQEINPVLEVLHAPPVALPVTVQWYYMNAGRQHGPIQETELKSLLAAGKVGPEDMVWRDGLPNWMQARSVEGLVPPRATTGVKVRLVCPPDTSADSGVFQSLGKRLLTRNKLKFYVNGKYKTENNRLQGTDLKFEVGPGNNEIEVVWWDGDANREVARKKFDMTFPAQGEYEIRFNFVPSPGVFRNGMQNSTLEVLKEPG